METFTVIMGTSRNQLNLHIVNYKLSYKINQNIRPQIIALDKKIKLTVYKHATQHVNVTGIRSLKKLKYIQTKIYSLGKAIEIIEEKIDAIMLSRKGYGNFKAEHIYKICQNMGAKTFYNPELFPAVYCTFPGLPTISLFRTTSVQALGVKNSTQIHKIRKIVETIFSALSGTITST